MTEQAKGRARELFDAALEQGCADAAQRFPEKHPDIVPSEIGATQAESNNWGQILACVYNWAYDQTQTENFRKDKGIPDGMSLSDWYLSLRGF